MNKKEMVAELIENEDSIFTENERKFLMSLDEDQVTQLHEQLTENGASERNVGQELDQEGDSEDDESVSGKTDDRHGSKAIKGKFKVGGKKGKKFTKNEDVDDDEDSSDESDEDDSPTDNEVEAYIEKAPKELREVLREGMLAVNEERDEAIKTITENANNDFEEEELRAMPLKQLRSLAKIAAAPVKNERKVRRGDRGLFSGQEPIADIADNESGGEMGEMLELPSMTWNGSDEGEDATPNKKKKKKMAC